MRVSSMSAFDVGICAYLASFCGLLLCLLILMATSPKNDPSDMQLGALVVIMAQIGAWALAGIVWWVILHVRVVG